MQRRKYVVAAVMAVALATTGIIVLRFATDRRADPKRSNSALAGPTKTVSFAGYETEVPASWPVYDLNVDPTRCVRFDQHAVYLGTPGPDQNCPAHAVGRSEALLVSPLDPNSGRGVSPPSQSEQGIVQADLRGAGVSVTASYVEGDESRGMAMSFVTPDAPRATSSPSATASPSAAGATNAPRAGRSTPADAGTRAGATGSASSPTGPADATSPAPTPTTDPASGQEPAGPDPSPTAGDTADPTNEPGVEPSVTPTDAANQAAEGAGANTPSTGTTQPSAGVSDPTTTSTGQQTPPEGGRPTATTGAGTTNDSPDASATSAGTPGATLTAAPGGDGVITPTATRPPVPRMPLPAAAPVRLLTQGFGFDTCAAPSLPSMAAWRGTSLKTVGIYVGGGNRACPDGNLSASWVKTVHGYGYTFAPIYVGLQPPCTTFSRRIDPRQALAQSQGVTAANDAVANMQRFGFGTRNPIFLDIEFFTPPPGDTTCSKAVLAYQTGWVRRLHELNYTAGLYTASGGVRDLAAIAPTSSPTSTFTIPDVVWLARWNKTADTDFAPHAPAALWNLRRLKQYTGGHAETHSGVEINIDSNYIDGVIARPGNF